MSQFDPNNKDNPTLADYIRGLFVERNVIFRNGPHVMHFRLPTNVQAVLAAVTIVLAVWGGYASIMYALNDQIIQTKEEKIAEARNAYKDLLVKVAAYERQVSEITHDLETNHTYSVDLAQQNETLKDRVEKAESELSTKIEERDQIKAAGQKLAGRLSRLSSALGTSVKPAEAEVDEKQQEARRERDFLFKRMHHLKLQLNDGLKDQNPVWGSIDVESLEFKASQSLLKLDLVSRERDELRKEVLNLERLVTEMQETQLEVFDRMSVLAKDGIGTIEQQLNGIEKTLQSNGKSVETLMDEGKDILGQGGPFIPAELPDLRHGPLNMKLGELHGLMDRWARLTDLERLVPVGRPLDTIRITAPFGYRRDPFNGRRAKHEGLDLGERLGSNIYARAPGVVRRAGRWGWYGNMVEVKHDLGFITRYAHMHRINVKRGDRIKAGQVIGLVGNTGRSTGSHLHYEIRIDRKPVNPISFIRATK